MAERKESSFTGRELGGVALFTLSIFPVVLVALALAKGGPGEAGGTAALARGLIESVGYWPTLFCGVGFAAVGATLLLSSREIEVGRHLSGALFGAIGLAVILGAFHDRPTGLLHGGDFGAATGGALRSVLGAWAGALVGGAILFLAVWLAWLGGSIALPARKKPESAATLSDALTEKDTDGVSAAEATALVPDASTLAYMEELWRRTAASSTQTVPVPPSPYPDDVRLQGDVPDGARPLPTSDESTATSGEAETAAAGGLGAPAGPAADVGAGPDLAGAGEADAGARHGGALGEQPGADPFGREAQELSLSPEAARALAGSPADPAPPAHPNVPEGARPLVVEDVGGTPGDGPPVPVWEASPEPEASATSLVRHAPEEEEALEDTDADEEDPEAAEYEAEEEDPEAAEYEEDEEDEEDPEAAEYEEDEEGDEVEEDESEAAEYEDDEEYEEEDEVAAEYEEDEEGEEEDDELEEEAELDDGEEWEEEDDEGEEAELEEPVEEEEPETAEVESSREEPEAAEPEVDPGPGPASGAGSASGPGAEPEVVLQPQPAPEGTPERTRLVFDAGKLFLQQGRVAVSLLQRRFGLEFDDACEVLDELQEVGLIGPYRGGQKRDILLTPEEWETRAEAL